jgi:hypothetical protein
VTQICTSRIEAIDRHAESSYSIPVQAPYRLDLTINVLRRLSTNLVDVLRPDGAYVRSLGEGTEVAAVRVYQRTPPRYPTIWEACVNAINRRMLKYFGRNSEVAFTYRLLRRDVLS